MKYKKVIGTILSKIDDKFVIIKGNEVFTLNEVSSRIFDLCNGKNEDTYIIELLSKFYDVTILEIENDINEFFNVLLNQELIKKAN